MFSGVRYRPDHLCGHLWRVGLPGGGRPHLLRRQSPANGSGNGNDSRTSGSGCGDRQVGEGGALRVGHQASGLGGGNGSIGRSLRNRDASHNPPYPLQFQIINSFFNLPITFFHFTFSIYIFSFFHSLTGSLPTPISTYFSGG